MWRLHSYCRQTEEAGPSETSLCTTSHPGRLVMSYIAKLQCIHADRHCRCGMVPSPLVKFLAKPLAPPICNYTKLLYDSSRFRSLYSFNSVFWCVSGYSVGWHGELWSYRVVLLRYEAAYQRNWFATYQRGVVIVRCPDFREESRRLWECMWTVDGAATNRICLLLHPYVLTHPSLVVHSSWTFR